MITRDQFLWVKHGPVGPAIAILVFHQPILVLTNPFHSLLHHFPSFHSHLKVPIVRQTQRQGDWGLVTQLDLRT